MKVPLLDLARQYDQLADEISPAVHRVMESGHFILGTEVSAFEREVAGRLGARDAIGVGSGTDALWLGLRALDIGPGDHVLTTPFTFFATISAIMNTGARPLFADIDPTNYHIDPEQAEAALKAAGGKRIRALLPVHLFGQAADLEPLMRAADRYGLQIVEDAAQAFGARYGDRPVGGIGAVTCFSFFPTKTLGAYGDGGMVTTNLPEVGQKLRRLRAHGGAAKYVHELIGTNSRLDELQAAILHVKLRHIDDWIERRRAIAFRYTAKLKPLEGLIVPPDETTTRTHTYSVYTIRVTEGRRNALREFLNNLHVETTIYYPLPAHLQPALKDLGYEPGAFPQAETACDEVLSLPIFPEMTAEEQDYVISAIIEWATRVG